LVTTFCHNTVAVKLYGSIAGKQVTMQCLHISFLCSYLVSDTHASCQISLDTAMETWEDDLRRFILEQEEEDDEFF
jgi:hypothetical protein